MLQKSNLLRKQRVLKKKIGYFFYLQAVIFGIYNKKLYQSRYRSSNIRRNRKHALQVIREKDDVWFKKSYRLSKPVFYNVLEKIKGSIETLNIEMALRSSGSPINAEILLAATLRYLAGGSYIDIVDLYDLPHTCPHRYFWRTLHAIDQAIDNIKLPQNSDEWYELSHSWNSKMKSQFGMKYLKGTTLAVDGIVIETRKPLYSEVGGNITGNFNRKGYYAMVALSAVDVWARFLYSELDWFGSTNDNVAIKYTTLYDSLVDSKIPPQLHIIGDEAFCATHEQIITPYSRRSLRKFPHSSPTYIMRRTFNYLLSYQRCTVERSFGMLVRKFLILTRRFDCKRSIVKLIFRVCCKLHNLCIDEWLQTKPINDFSCNYECVHENDYPDYTNEVIVDLVNNDPLGIRDDPNPRQPKQSTKNKKTQVERREKIAERIYNKGFRYHS